MAKDELLSIGEVARASGLSMSALRFYDRSGVLVPAEVAADTGYRWYSPSQVEAARLLARLRRVGLPLAEISMVLAREDPQAMDRILTDHLRRLEEGLEAARAEVQRIRQRWIDDQRSTVVLVAGEDLIDALRAVRYAVGSDSEWPALQGVLFETAHTTMRVTATDRYRAAFHQIPASETSTQVREVVLAAFVDHLMEQVGEADKVELTFGGGQVRARFAGTVLKSPVLEIDFPDLSRAVPPVMVSSVVDGDQLLAELQDVPHARTWSLGVGADGTLALSPQAHSAEEHEVVLDAEFLTQAARALGPGQLQLDLAGGISPLAIRNTETPGRFSIIMPIRPEEERLE